MAERLLREAYSPEDVTLSDMADRFASHSDVDEEDDLPARQRSLTWPPAPDSSRRCSFCVGLTISTILNLTQRNQPNVFWGSAYDHHASLEELGQSAYRGCDFCHFMIDCLKRARSNKTESRLGDVSIQHGYYGDDSVGEFDDRSLYMRAKKMEEPSRVRLAIFPGMYRKLRSSEVAGSEPPTLEQVYETLWVRVGKLRPMNPKLTVLEVVETESAVEFHND